MWSMSSVCTTCTDHPGGEGSIQHYLLEGKLVGIHKIIMSLQSTPLLRLVMQDSFAACTDCTDCKRVSFVPCPSTLNACCFVGTTEGLSLARPLLCSLSRTREALLGSRVTWLNGFKSPPPTVNREAKPYILCPVCAFVCYVEHMALIGCKQRLFVCPCDGMAGKVLSTTCSTHSMAVSTVLFKRINVKDAYAAES